MHKNENQNLAQEAMIEIMKINIAANNPPKVRKLARLDIGYST